MIILAAAAAAVQMTSCLFCALQVFRHRNETRDYTRQFVGLCAILFAGASLFTVLTFAFYPQDNLYYSLINATVLIFGLLAQILAVIYPLCVLRPLNLTNIGAMLLPWLVLVFFYALTPDWTPIGSLEDLWAHIGEANVILRLLTLALYFPYLIWMLLLLPRHLSDIVFSPVFLGIFGVAVVLIVALHFVFFFTGNLIWMILHDISFGVLLYLVTIFDMEVRLLPKEEAEPGPIPPLRPHQPAQPEHPSGLESIEIRVSEGKTLWERVCQAMDQEEIWRQPDLSVESLARICGSNVPYVSSCIKKETGYGANEYINRKRIGFVCSSLEKDPAQNLNDVFYDAGYRARTTAWRNFRDIMGISPSEYRFSQR